MKAFTKIVLLSLFLFFLICCSKESTTEPKANVVGTYILTQVNGEGLPYLAEETADWQEFLSGGELELIQSGRFEWEITWMKVELTGTTFAYDDGDGNYMVNGNTITFVPTSGDQFTGSFSNNILTIIGGLEDDITFTFIRN